MTMDLLHKFSQILQPQPGTGGGYSQPHRQSSMLPPSSGDRPTRMPIGGRNVDNQAFGRFLMQALGKLGLFGPGGVPEWMTNAMNGGNSSAVMPWENDPNSGVVAPRVNNAPGLDVGNHAQMPWKNALNPRPPAPPASTAAVMPGANDRSAGWGTQPEPAKPSSLIGRFGDVMSPKPMTGATPTETKKTNPGSWSF